MKHNARRIGTVALVAALGAIAPAGMATAHVTLSETEAEAGSSARLNVVVPNESDDASTVKIQLTLPEDYPMVSVSPMDLPGWASKVETRELDEPINAYGRDFDEVVSQVTWTADSDDDGIGVDKFGEFGLKAGPIPEEVGATLVFKVIQTYSDGEEAPWIEAPKEGQPEPEHPAPTITVTAAGETADGAEPAGTDGSDTADTGGSIYTDTGTSALALIALVVAILAYRRGGSKTGKGTDSSPKPDPVPAGTDDRD